jgi:polyisoprenyl-phosphate glycosyltransferase
MAAQRKKPVLVSPPSVRDLNAQLVKRGMVAPLLSVVVPVKNEEDGILPFVERTGAILDSIAHDNGWEILFVDDGSSDSTLAAIVAANQRDPRVRALSLSRNFGKEAALSAGIDHARGNAVIPMDVDMQDPPEVLPEMVGKWRDGYDMVFGVRRCRDSDGWAKRVTAGLYYRAHNAVSKDKIPENAGDFRLMDRKVVDVIRALPERNRFMKGLFAWVGFNAIGVPYERPQRAAGSSKFNLWRLWNFALDGVVSFSTVPLRASFYGGLVIAAIAVLYALFIIGRVLIFGIDTPGYASLLIAVLGMGAIQLVSIGIIGEYLGRLFLEVKGRPIYVVEGVYEEQTPQA